MRMNYVVLGTNDMRAAATFYEQLFDGAETHRLSPTERMTYWLGEDFAFALAIPFNEKSATIGNGSMVGFNVGSRSDVERLHASAIRLGGVCDGKPGQRGPRFSAYVRDLDGNKLCLSD